MNIRRILLLLLLPLLFSACTSYKKSLYLRDDEVLEMVPQKGMLYEYRIMPKDELTIVVSTSAPEASSRSIERLGRRKNNLHQIKVWIMRSCWPIWLTMTDILIFPY